MLPALGQWLIRASLSSAKPAACAFANAGEAITPFSFSPSSSPPLLKAPFYLLGQGSEFL